MDKFVYSFNEGSKDMRSLLGGKGANLAEMTKIGLPVPFGFTVTTEACTRYYEEGGQIADGIKDEIYEKLAELRLKDHPQDSELQLLISLLKPYVSRPGRYRCSHCGFKAKGFQWLCPGCSSWGSYSPKREEES